MKITSLFTVCVAATFAAIILNCDSLFAQDSQPKSATSERTIGIGVKFTPFSLATLIDEAEIVPPGRINVIINATRGFRIELETGYMSRDYKDQDEKISSFLFGAGFLGGVRKNDVKIMGGIKFDYITAKDKFTSGNDEEELKASRFSLGPVLQGEYYFSNHFSAGIDVSLKYSIFKYETLNGPFNAVDENEVNSFFTESGIFVRYFF